MWEKVLKRNSSKSEAFPTLKGWRQPQLCLCDIEYELRLENEISTENTITAKYGTVMHSTLRGSVKDFQRQTPALVFPFGWETRSALH